jgi:hypothetical protein
MALSSPGTEITIVDESQYLPAAPNSIPLVVIATAQNKINASGTGVATATTKANAGKLYQVTSQRDLITYYGNPFFYKTTSGTSIQGYELNEYGLLAAYSALGSTNLVYAIRADIDLAALVGKTSRPSSAPDNGSWWLDTSTSTWGIYEFNASTGTFTSKTPLVLTGTDLVPGTSFPSDSLGSVGDYAVALNSSDSTTAINFDKAPDTNSTYFKKVKPLTTGAVATWVAVGSPEWQGAVPTITTSNTEITASTAGKVIVTMNTTTASFTGVINNGSDPAAAGNILTVTSGTAPAVDQLVVGSGVLAGTYIVSGSGTSFVVSKSQLVGSKVAEVTGSIAGTTLTVTAVASGSLGVGTLLIGSHNVPVTAAGNLVSGETYTITTVGNADWVAAGATESATISAGKIIGAELEVSDITISAGKLAVGAALTGITGVTAGSYITAQTHKYVTRYTASAVATGSITLSNIAGLEIGMSVRGEGITTAATISAIDSTNKVITLSQSGAITTASVYNFYSATSAVDGDKGLYRTSISQASEVSITAGKVQPLLGTTGATFTANAAAAALSTLGTGAVTQSIKAGTYISGVLTTGATSTYTVTNTQNVTSLTISGYSSPLTSQAGKSITMSSGEAATKVATEIGTANLPFVSTGTDSGKSVIYATKDGAVLNVGGDAVTLAALGLEADAYYSPTCYFGTNANQPKWRTTDTESRPTGSVWVKTNASNGGLSLAVSQYSSASAAYINKTVTIDKSDWSVNNELDSTGGKAIPVNTVYAQVSFDQSAPVQLYYRAASGASVFTGNSTSMTFTTGDTFNVQVSEPGSSALSSTIYPVTIAVDPANTAGVQAKNFTYSWATANIPYTTATVDSVTGAIVLTHTEGGVIVLDDTSILSTSALESAGFGIGDIYSLANSTGVLGAKYGPYKTVTKAFSNTTFELTVSVTYTGTKVDSVSINNDGTTNGTGTYTVTDGTSSIVVKLNSATSASWVSGFPTPQYTVQLSNWEPFEYISDTTAPVNNPVTGTPWYYSTISQVDLMVNVGSTWKGIQNALYDDSGTAYATSSGASGTNSTGIIIAATEPEAQTNGSQLQYGDLWLDTGDLENYPVIYRWRKDATTGVKSWTLIDNTDQTTEDGILFADARWGADGSVDPVNDSMPTITSMLTSDYVDLDAPDPTAYPQGMILFNTRRSGYNVKKFVTKHFTTANYPDASGTVGTKGALPAKEYTWVSASGLKTDGSPYMGRKAQRAMVVAAMKATLDNSSELRDEETKFNLITAPGYPELQPNMVSLNNDRNQTAYIIGDTPLRLADDANAITAWATNAKGATGTGEDGFVTRNTYLGVYYPSGITTDLTGADVVVPASHMMLRTMIYNDTVAYPWFAPAGMRRGVIDNASNIGYIDAASGEFKTTKNRVALRDIEYTNMINPIAFFNNIGLLNYGNKNSFDSQSALDRTNVARLICYIRDRLQVAVRPFIFEPNDTNTRSQIKAVINTLFADIQTKRGIYDYLVVCDESNNTPARIDRNELWLDIAIEPAKAVEFVYVPVRILNTGEIKAGA